MITDESGEQHQPTLEEGWAEVVADRRATDPPVRNVFKKGAIAIRDHRVWCAPPLFFTSSPCLRRGLLSLLWHRHRGMPSDGELPRHMVALVYTSSALHPHSASPAPTGGREYTNFNP